MLDLKFLMLKFNYIVFLQVGYGGNNESKVIEQRRRWPPQTICQ